MTLLKRLKEYVDHGAISMHVPGHKNNTIGKLDDLLLLEYDMTEIEGLDNLHNPVEILNDLNVFLSNKFPGYHAQAMVNGTTNGILSAIFALNKRCESFVLCGEIHKSVYHALDLGSLNYTNVTKEDLFSYDFKKKSLILTSPTYQGDIPIDLVSIVKYVHDQGGYVVIDAAHGSHFSITSNFPESPSLSGADIIVESYHKMLPALTMASVIFVKDSLFDDVRYYINHFETSSPSYLIMASIEYAQQFYDDYWDDFFFKRRSDLIKHLSKQGILVREANDPCKVILNWKHGPYALENSLIAQNIYAEMTTEDGVLFVLPLWHEGDRYPFEELLERLSCLTIVEKEDFDIQDITSLLDKICVENVVPYPPGIPLILKGERFTEGHLKQLQQYLFNRVKIEGIDNNINYYL